MNQRLILNRLVISQSESVPSRLLPLTRNIGLSDLAWIISEGRRETKIKKKKWEQGEKIKYYLPVGTISIDAQSEKWTLSVNIVD